MACWSAAPENDEMFCRASAVEKTVTDEPEPLVGGIVGFGDGCGVKMVESRVTVCLMMD